MDSRAAEIFGRQLDGLEWAELYNQVVMVLIKGRYRLYVHKVNPTYLDVEYVADSGVSFRTESYTNERIPDDVLEAHRKQYKEPMRPHYLRGLWSSSWAEVGGFRFYFKAGDDYITDVLPNDDDFSILRIADIVEHFLRAIHWEEEAYREMLNRIDRYQMDAGW